MPVVTPETFIRAETDRYFANLAAQAGGVNRWNHYREFLPLDRQSVVRMNKDTLYSSNIVDTEQGATIIVPPSPDGRYVSVYLADNDHYVPFVIYEPGRHALPRDTKYLFVALRIQLFDPSDPEEIKLVNNLQDQFVIEAGSADPFTPPDWDQASLNALRAAYENRFQTYQQYEADWQGPRGTVNEKTRHLAAAGAWGLFPERDAVYINYSGRHDPDICHTATYAVPENDAFWSITVYGQDGYMKSENNLLNSSNVALNADGTFTAWFGSSEACGDRPNRLDVTEGWNFLMRVYRPGRSVLQRQYTLPKPKPATP